MMLQRQWKVLLCVILAFALAVADIDKTPETERSRVLRGLSCTGPRQLLQSGERLNVDDEVFTSDGYASIKQEHDGNLVVRRTSDAEVLCESGVNDSSNGAPYFTTLFGDGNLITWSSTELIPPAVWKSNAVGTTSSTYFLAVNCDDSVSIYQGAVSSPQSVLWTCPTSGQSTPSSMTSMTTTTMATSTTTEMPAPPSQPITTFCVVADAPYRHEESLKLLDQIDNMDSECEFVAHLGDIRSARMFDTCVRETYTNASLIMKRSAKPVLMMLGGK